MCGSFDIMYFIIGIFQLCIVLLSELSRIVGFSINPSNVKSTLSTAKEEKKKKGVAKPRSEAQYHTRACSANKKSTKKQFIKKGPARTNLTEKKNANRPSHIPK